MLDRMFWPRVFDRVRHDPDPPRPYSEMGPAIWAQLRRSCRPPGRGASETRQRHSTRIQACGNALRRSASRRRFPRQPHAPRQTSFSVRTSGGSRLHSIRTGTRPGPAGGAAGTRSCATATNDWHSSPLRPRRVLNRRSNGRSSRNSEGNEQEALDLYTSAHARGHVAAALSAGRLLLLRNDPAGVALIDAAMSADPMHVEDGCSAIVEFLQRQGRFADAHPYQVRQSRQATHNRMAAAERTEVTGIDRFSPGSHPELDVAALARALASERAVQRAWLAAKALRHSAGTQTVLAVLTKGTPRPDLAEHLRRDGVLPEDVVMVVLGRHDRQLQAALDSAGATVIFGRAV